MAFIEPMHRNKPNITYLLTYIWSSSAWKSSKMEFQESKMGHISRSMY